MSRLTDKDWKNPESLMWIKLGFIPMRNEGYREFLSYALRKLARYEDLEEQLEKLYDGKMSLDEVVENLNRVIQNGEEKLDYARILTNAEAEKWDKWKDLEKQGRLIELPCAVGDTVYWISESDACLFCNGPCYERCEEGALKIKEIPFKPHMLNEIGEIIFLTKEEAEAKLAEMEGAE